MLRLEEGICVPLVLAHQRVCADGGGVRWRRLCSRAVRAACVGVGACVPRTWSSCFGGYEPWCIHTQSL